MLYEYDDLETFIKDKDSKDLESTKLTIECDSDIDIIKISDPNKFKIGLTKTPFNLVISSNRVDVIKECESLCFVCGNDYRHGYKDTEIDNYVCNLYYGKTIEIYTSDNFKLAITKINRTDGTIEGEMRIDAISATFNHASCNCEFYITLGDDDTKVYKEVQFTSQFTIRGNELTITLIPAIIM
jgi:exopolysaccharide biosynthesis protein